MVEQAPVCAALDRLDLREIRQDCPLEVFLLKSTCVQSGISLHAHPMPPQRLHALVVLVDQERLHQRPRALGL